LRLFIFLISTITFINNGFPEGGSNNHESTGHLQLNPIPFGDQCENLRISISLHREKRTKSAWLNPDHILTFEIDDSNYKTFVKNYNLIFTQNHGFVLPCIATQGNWYQIQDKQGNKFWTSPISYSFQCADRIGSIDNITYFKEL